MSLVEVHEQRRDSEEDSNSDSINDPDQSDLDIALRRHDVDVGFDVVAVARRWSSIHYESECIGEIVSRSNAWSRIQSREHEVQMSLPCRKRRAQKLAST